MIFDYNIGKYEDGISLMDLLKADDILKRIPKLYVPEVETYDGGRMFINNGATVFIKESGPVKIRFILFDKNGRAITTPESAFTQLNFKQAKYLARFSCPAMNMSGPNLSFDYFVDISAIKFASASSMHMQKNDKSGTEIIEDYQYRFVPSEIESTFDSSVSQFDQSRDEILEKYFK